MSDGPRAISRPLVSAECISTEVHASRGGGRASSSLGERTRGKGAPSCLEGNFAFGALSVLSVLPESADKAVRIHLFDSRRFCFASS